jgi:hypothetical protein
MQLGRIRAGLLKSLVILVDQSNKKPLPLPSSKMGRRKTRVRLSMGGNQEYRPV